MVSVVVAYTNYRGHTLDLKNLPGHKFTSTVSTVAFTYIHTVDYYLYRLRMDLNLGHSRIRMTFLWGLFTTSCSEYHALLASC
jgi:hypothetical protein